MASILPNKSDPLPRFRKVSVAILSSALLVVFLFAPVLESSAVAQENASTAVSLDLRDADLRGVFLKLADKAKINLLVSPKVKGTVTFRVTDMEPVELIEFLARTNGLEIEKHGRILLILAEDAPPSRVRFEIIPLQNAKAEEVAKIIQSLRLDKRATVTHDSRTNRIIVVYPD